MLHLENFFEKSFALLLTTPNDSHCLKYMFTTEKLAVYAENFERQPFTTGIFNITPFYPEEEVLKDGKPVLGPDGKPLKRPGSKKKYRYVAASKIF